MPKVKIAGHSISVPGHPVLRIALGLALCLGGVLGFMPVLGFWMIPLGLVVLSVDFPPVRRFRRNFTVKLGYWLQRRWPRVAKSFGFGPARNRKH